MAAAMRQTTYCKLRTYFLLFESTNRRDIWKHLIIRHISHRKMFIGSPADEKRLQIEFGNIAKFADGAVTASLGDTAVLTTVVSRTEALPGAAFMPLTVDYRQKAAAAGRIPINHLRRELGPSDKEILTCRLIDRSLRSSFPDGYLNETQITCNLLAVDGVNDPDIVSINAASAALTLSDIPWNGPIGAVRIGCDPNRNLLLNPTRKQQLNSIYNLVVVANKHKEIVMLEGDAKNVPAALVLDGIEYGLKHATDIAHDLSFRLQNYSNIKRTFKPTSQIAEIWFKKATRYGASIVRNILTDYTHDKISRDKALSKARFIIVKMMEDDTLLMKGPDASDLIESGVNMTTFLHEIVNKMIKTEFRNLNITTLKRCDGRTPESVRRISSQVDLYAPLHGSSIFQRGQTQVLSTVTFDSLQAAARTDPISVITGSPKEKKFLLHYEFPSYAINEIKAPGAQKNRRELGHGALAEKGLKPLVPEDIPFCIRLTCEVLESNGSSSMASICGGSLALMDAGVKIKEPAAGVAMGLISSSYPVNNESVILTDLMGIEDYFGDMDFKIGGTYSGLTALQLDLKLPGVPFWVIQSAIVKAAEKIKFIIQTMTKSAGIFKPRESPKANAPVVENITVLPAKRSSFIGVGGNHLRRLQAETGVTISTVNESTFEIFAPNQDAMNEAKEMMDKWLTAMKEPELEFNAVYEAKIVELREIGVMVQLHPAMSPVLLHNSQLDHRRVSHPSALGLNVGDLISVKYFGREPNTGKIRLSRKVITAPTSKTFRYMND